LQFIWRSEGIARKDPKWPIMWRYKLLMYLAPSPGTKREVIPKVFDGSIFNDSDAKEQLFFSDSSWTGTINNGVNHADVWIFKGEQWIKIETFEGLGVWQGPLFLKSCFRRWIPNGHFELSQRHLSQRQDFSEAVIYFWKKSFFIYLNFYLTFNKNSLS